MTEVEDFLSEKGLIRISSLDELLENKSFLVDTSFGNAKSIAIYPVDFKRVRLQNDLMGLYGIHWRYETEIPNWESLNRHDGDTLNVLTNIKQGITPQSRPFYNFTQRDINLKSPYWSFNPSNSSWDYFNDILLPTFRRDVEEYNLIKKSFVKK